MKQKKKSLDHGRRTGFRSQVIFSVSGRVIEIQHTVLNHDVIIHMEKGKVRFRCTMSNMVKQLENDYFCLCNSCYLINLKKVVSIQGDMVLVKDKWLKISQPKKKEFIRQVAAYMGGSL